MSSESSAKLGYLKERIVNAYGMLRRGEFGLIVRNLGVEANHRIEAVSGKTRHNTIIAARTVRISARQARLKLQQMRSPEHIPVEENFDTAPSDQVIPDSAFRNRRKLIPPSPRPTGARLYRVTDLQVDGKKLLSALSAISDAIKPSRIS